VTIDLDVNTHLPLRRTFEWRNETFKDHDEDAEEYDEYHDIQGLPTPFAITPVPQRRHGHQSLSRRWSMANRLAPSSSIPTVPSRRFTISTEPCGAAVYTQVC